MSRLQAVYYRARDGSEPVDDFIEELNPKSQVALDNQIDRLNLLTTSNPQLPFPHSSQVEGSFVSFAVTTGRSSIACSTFGLEI